MKKFYLVLVAMIFPFLASDLYGATTTQGRRQKTSTTKKKTGTATNTRGGKATVAKGGKQVGKQGGGKANTKTGNSSTKKKPSAGGRSSGAQSSPNSEAEMRALGQMERGEDGLKKGLAAISRKLDLLNNEVGALSAISDELADVQSTLTTIESKVEQVDEIVNLTYGANQGANAPFDDPSSDPSLQDDGVDGSEFDDVDPQDANDQNLFNPEVEYDSRGHY